MSFFCFFRIRECFGDILDVDEWPGEIVSTSGGVEPRGCFCKTCCCMKVSYGSLNNLELINVIYGLWCVFGHECNKVLLVDTE